MEVMTWELAFQILWFPGTYKEDNPWKPGCHVHWIICRTWHDGRVVTKIFHLYEVLQALEVLPVAPPPEPKPLTAEEVKRLEEQEEDTFRELRIFLRNVTHRLAIDKRFRVFTKPVDPDEVLIFGSNVF